MMNNGFNLFATLLIVLGIFLLPVAGFAQSQFSPARLTKQNGDTLDGYVKMMKGNVAHTHHPVTSLYSRESNSVVFYIKDSIYFRPYQRTNTLKLPISSFPQIEVDDQLFELHLITRPDDTYPSHQYIALIADGYLSLYRFYAETSNPPVLHYYLRAGTEIVHVDPADFKAQLSQHFRSNRALQKEMRRGKWSYGDIPDLIARFNREH